MTKPATEERVAHTPSAADFTPWTFQMLHDIGESMRHDATVVLTDATGTDYLIDGFKLRDGVAKILIVERYQRSESQPSSEQTSETEIRTALVDALRPALPNLEWANIHGSRCEELLAQARAALSLATEGRK